MAGNINMEHLYRKLEKIESLLSEMARMKAPIAVEQLEVKGPLVEYRFDEVDVDEVSGSLNIGLNLGVPMDEKNKTENDKSNKKKKTNHPSTTVNETSSALKDNNEVHHTGYRDIEQYIEEKLQELFPKNPNIHAQQHRSTNWTKGEKSEQPSPIDQTIEEIMGQEEPSSMVNTEIKDKRYSSENVPHKETNPPSTYHESTGHFSSKPATKLPVINTCNNNQKKTQVNKKKRRLTRTSTGRWFLLSLY